jgi:hypothetical protein
MSTYRSTLAIPSKPLLETPKEVHPSQYSTFPKVLSTAPDKCATRVRFGSGA